MSVLVVASAMALVALAAAVVNGTGSTSAAAAGGYPITDGPFSIAQPQSGATWTVGSDVTIEYVPDDDAVVFQTVAYLIRPSDGATKYLGKANAFSDYRLTTRLTDDYTVVTDGQRTTRTGIAGEWQLSLSFFDGRASHRRTIPVNVSYQEPAGQERADAGTVGDEEPPLVVDESNTIDETETGDQPTGTDESVSAQPSATTGEGWPSEIGPLDGKRGTYRITVAFAALDNVNPGMTRPSQAEFDAVADRLAAEWRANSYHQSDLEFRLYPELLSSFERLPNPRLPIRRDIMTSALYQHPDFYPSGGPDGQEQMVLVGGIDSTGGRGYRDVWMLSDFSVEEGRSLVRTLGRGWNLESPMGKEQAGWIEVDGDNDASFIDVDTTAAATYTIHDESNVSRRFAGAQRALRIKEANIWFTLDSQTASGEAKSAGEVKVWHGTEVVDSLSAGETTTVEIHPGQEATVRVDSIDRSGLHSARIEVDMPELKPPFSVDVPEQLTIGQSRVVTVRPDPGYRPQQASATAQLVIGNRTISLGSYAAPSNDWELSVGIKDHYWIIEDGEQVRVDIKPGSHTLRFTFRNGVARSSVDHPVTVRR